MAESNGTTRYLRLFFGVLVLVAGLQVMLVLPRTNRFVQYGNVEQLMASLLVAGSTNSTSTAALLPSLSELTETTTNVSSFILSPERLTENIKQAVGLASPTEMGSASASAAAAASEAAAKPRKRPSKLDIFYNVFWPKEPVKFASESTDHIVSTQLKQMADSYGGQTFKPLVHIMSIQGRALDSQRKVDDMCQRATKGRLNCTLASYEEDGGELQTLSHLYEYCEKEAASNRSNSRVAYLHNKGSFHPGQGNTRWRVAMTGAVMNRECIDPPDGACSVCGLQFASPPKMFTNLFPGNFFVTSCDYVLKLHHPQTFQKRYARLIAQVKKMGRRGKFFLRSSDSRPWSLGAHRYGPEHWIGSHPEIKPCDLSVPPDYWYWMEKRRRETEFNFSMYPRAGRWEWPDARPTISNDTSSRILSYRLLAGQLYRHIQLYNKTPPVDSWMYDWYPDGQFWKDCVQQYGKLVVEVVTSPQFKRTDPNACAPQPSVK